MECSCNKERYGSGIGGITAVSTVLPHEWGQNITVLPHYSVQNTRESSGDGVQACGTTAVMGLGCMDCELRPYARTGDCVFASFSRSNFHSNKVQSLLFYDMSAYLYICLSLYTVYGKKEATVFLGITLTNLDIV